MEFTFGFVDAAILFVLLISGLIAFYRGFVKEALGVTSWIFSVFAGLYGIPVLRPLYERVFENPLIIDIASGISVALIVLIAFTILVSRINAKIRDSALSGLDRIFGFVFGVARGILIVLLVYVLAIIIMPGEVDKAAENNFSITYVEDGVDALKKILPEYVSEDLKERQKEAEEVKAKRLKAGEKVFEKLNNPKPAAETKPEDSGYDDKERKDLDGLIDALEEGTTEE